MSDPKKPRALHGPYKADEFNGLSIWGTDKDGDASRRLDVRGWGYLTGGGHGALGLSEHEAIDEQHRFARFVADALNMAESDLVFGLKLSLESLLEIINASHGVVGFHPNGDVAKWSEFKSEIRLARKFLAEAKARGQAS